MCCSTAIPTPTPRPSIISASSGPIRASPTGPLPPVIRFVSGTRGAFGPVSIRRAGGVSLPVLLSYRGTHVPRSQAAGGRLECTSGAELLLVDRRASLLSGAECRFESGRKVQTAGRNGHAERCELESRCHVDRTFMCGTPG